MKRCFVVLVLLMSCRSVYPQSSDGDQVRVIVQFSEPAALLNWKNRVRAAEPSLIPIRPVKSIVADAEFQSIRNELRVIQDTRLAEIRARFQGIGADYRYLDTFNGVALTIGIDQLEALRRQPGVLAVFGSFPLEPEDSYTDEVIGTVRAWSLLSGEYGKTRPGEGVRIAIIDTGIISDHPSFSDQGFTAPAGFPVSEIVRGGVRTPWLGAPTNQKVIVNNIYAPPGASVPTNITSGHGSAVAAAAAGVPVNVGVYGTDVVAQGVAPYAYLLGLRVLGEVPEYLAAIDDAVRYEADVVNVSQGTSLWLSWAEGRNPIQEALEALAEAGVLVCFSAGNAGTQGSGTITGTFKYSDQVLVAGNHASGRPLATGEVSAVAPEPAANAPNLQRLRLESTFPFRSALRAPLQVTAMVRDSRGHVEDSHARKALYPFPPGSLAGKIALAERGSVEGLSALFADKWRNVQAGGAVALIVYNDAHPGEPGYRSFGLFMTGDPFAVIERVGGLAIEQAARNFGSSFAVEIAPSTLFPQSNNTVSSSSSRGPTPGLRIKPDLVAPGTSVLLPEFSGDDMVPSGFSLTSGTSFSSPAVAGSAALLRQAHPGWQAREIRAALVTTAETQMDSGGPARIMVQGSGSVRVDRALNAALHVSPYSLSLGRLSSGERRNVTVQIEDTRPHADRRAMEYRVHLEPRTAGPSITISRPAVTLAGAQQGYVALQFETGNATPGDYDGHVVISAPDGRRQSIPYFLRIPVPPTADVLLVLWHADGEAVSYRGRFETLLTQAGLRYDVRELYSGGSMPALEELQRYRLVIVSTGDVETGFITSLRGGSFPWQAFLNGGGRLLVTGHGYPGRLVYTSSIQNQGADFLLSSYAAGYYPVLTNPVPVSGQNVRIRLSGPLGEVDISSGGGGDGAQNQRGIDLGRPVTVSDLGLVGNALELAPQVHKLLSVAEIQVDGTPLAVSGFNNTAATGVWPDTTLERPTAGVSWGAVFLSFGLEGVQSVDGFVTGPEIMRRLYRWLVDDLSVRLETDHLIPGRQATLQAVVNSSIEGNDAKTFRWDLGDGSPVVSTASPTLRTTYARWPLRAPRVEVTDSIGHTVVSASPTYLPFLTTSEGWVVELIVHNVGTSVAAPEFVAFNDSGVEIARTRNRSLQPGGNFSIGLADLFPAVSTGVVHHVRIDSAGDIRALAVLTSADGEEMTTVPGLRWGQSQIYVPHISQAVDQYYTRYALIRTATGPETLQFEANGQVIPLNSSGAADSQDRRYFADLYGGSLPSGLEWGKFTTGGTAAILTGIELFGRVDGARQVAAMPLDGTVSTDLSFVHISSDSDLFWTGMVYVNVGDADTEIHLRSFAADGSLRSTGVHTLGRGDKQTLLYDRKRTTSVPSLPFDFTEDVAWLQVRSSQPLIGYEIFGTVDDSRVEGLTAAYRGATRLLFPYLRLGAGEWTGIAVVNLSDTPATATIRALDPAGRSLAEVPRRYGPYAKDLGLAQQLFGGTLPAGTSHLILESDVPLWGFELFGDTAERAMAGTNAIPIER